MKFGVFYLSVSLVKGRKDFDRQALKLPSGGVVYVRIEETHGVDLEEALDAARPAFGEIVLNACILP